MKQIIPLLVFFLGLPVCYDIKSGYIAGNRLCAARRALVIRHLKLFLNYLPKRRV